MDDDEDEECAREGKWKISVYVILVMNLAATVDITN